MLTEAGVEFARSVRRPISNTNAIAHDPSNQGEPSLSLPQWNNDISTLTFEGAVVLRLFRSAPNPRAILNEFERNGWKRRIANPLEPDQYVDNAKRFGAAVDRLNAGQSPIKIRFRRDGTGAGVTWEVVGPGGQA